MSRFGSLLPSLQIWINDAAAGFARLTGAARARRALRFVEGPENVFRLERLGGRRGAATIAQGLAIRDGALTPPPAPAVRAALRGARAEIALSSRHFLQRPLELPAQAAPFLDGVVRAQIDRITPWRASEAAFGAAPPESLGADRIVAQVVATPRARLAGYLEALAALGAGALTISTEIERQAGAVRVVVLSQSLGDAQGLRAWRRALTVGLGASALAALATIGAWSYMGLSLDAERAQLTQAIAGRRAALLAERKAAEGDAMAELDQRKREALPTVLTIEALSRILPDGTHLTEVSVEQGKATLSGLTDDAPRLIRIMEQSRQFTEATFSAPTTRAADETGDRFHIEARVERAWVGAP